MAEGCAVQCRDEGSDGCMHARSGAALKPNSDQVRRERKRVVCCTVVLCAAQSQAGKNTAAAASVAAAAAAQTKTKYGKHVSQSVGVRRGPTGGRGERGAHA